MTAVPSCVGGSTKRRTFGMVRAKGEPGAPMPHKVLPPRRAGHPPSEALIAERAAILATLRGWPFDTRNALSERQIAGVRCTVLTPPAPRARLVHFHGGG